MTKRRVTLSLDEDVVALLKSTKDRSMSSVANEALRKAFATEEHSQEAHRQALLAWLDELDERWGPPTPEDYAWAKKVLDEAFDSEDSAA
jgi:hypothetical protein